MLGLLLSVAWAELPPHSLEQHLADHTWSRAREQLDAGNAEQTLLTVNAFQTHVADAPNLHALAARAHIVLDDRPAAKREFEAAVAGNPDYTLAWYALAELHTEDAEWTESEAAWAHVERLVPNGPDADIAPLRRAEAAAHQGNAEAFETHLREAIRRGFNVSDIVASPQWRQFYADPALNDSVQKMLTVYGGPETLERLEHPIRPAP